MKANVKKHVIIGTLSAACIAMVCMIGTQFRTEIPSTEDEQIKESTSSEVTVEVITNAKEEKEPAVTNNTVKNEPSAEIVGSGKIKHDDFISNGGVEINQSFNESTKSTAPPPPEIDNREALTDHSEPPKYESEQVEIKPQITEPTSDTPQHGDKKDGMIYINGFGWVPDEGGGSKSEYAGGMYENGNKVGFFG